MNSFSDGQYHWLINNSMELSLEDIEKLDFETAFDIINRAKSQGFEKNSFAPGTIKFWQDVKTRIVTAVDSSVRGNNYGLRSQSVALSKGKI